MTDRDFSVLLIGVVRVWVGHRQRVEEYSRRFLERHAMRAQVRLRLFRIRLILYASSIARPLEKPNALPFRRGLLLAVAWNGWFG